MDYRPRTKVGVPGRYVHILLKQVKQFQKFFFLIFKTAKTFSFYFISKKIYLIVGVEVAKAWVDPGTSEMP